MTNLDPHQMPILGGSGAKVHPFSNRLEKGDGMYNFSGSDGRLEYYIEVFARLQGDRDVCRALNETFSEEENVAVT